MNKILAIFGLFFFIASKQKVLEKKFQEKDLTKNETFCKQKHILEMQQDDENKIFPIKIESIRTKEPRRNRIYLSSSYCQYELFVNDVLISRTMGEMTKKGGGITGAVPINQNLLYSGIHEVKLRMYPKYSLPIFDNRGGTVSLDFYYFIDDLMEKVYNNKMGGQKGLSIGQSEYHLGEVREPHNPPHNIEGLAVYEWRTTFEASVAFEQEAWLNSINLKKRKDKNKLKEELLNEYKKLHSVIKKRDIETYLEIVKDRELRLRTALYLTEKEQEERKEKFVSLLKDEKYDLLPLNEDISVLEYQAYGRLIFLSNNKDGKGIIRLVNRENLNEIVTLDFRFHRKKKGGPLTVI